MFRRLIKALIKFIFTPFFITFLYMHKAAGKKGSNGTMQANNNETNPNQANKKDRPVNTFKHSAFSTALTLHTHKGKAMYVYELCTNFSTFFQAMMMMMKVVEAYYTAMAYT